MDETIALQNAYLNMPNAKYTRAEAMDKAASVAMMTRGIAAPADISAAGTRQSAEDAAPAPEQKKAAVERNVAAQNQQPPAMPSAGSTNVEPTIDISTLTEEEFEALPEATLARLRGDLG